MNIADLLNEFHEWLDQPFGEATAMTRVLRRNLHAEEGKELLDALDSADIMAIAKELANVVYVTYGTAHVLGIDLNAVLGEVHRSNMSKLSPDGVVIREDGKVLKGPNYRPPNIAAILNDDRRREEARRA